MTDKEDEQIVNVFVCLRDIDNRNLSISMAYVVRHGEHRRNLYDFIWINCVAELNSSTRKKNEMKFISWPVFLAITFARLFRLIYRLVLPINAYILNR